MGFYTDVTTTVNDASVAYQINLNVTDGYEPTNLGAYRARLFLNYSDELSYVTGNPCGLMVDSVDAGYDDWNCSFRPPRIDYAPRNFNAELILPLSIGTNDFTLTGHRGDTDLESISVSGASMLDDGVKAYNPANIIVEELVASSNIKKIYNDGNMVFVDTKKAHGFLTGDAITITGLPDGAGEYSTVNHFLGENGARVMGTFTIIVTGEKSFKFMTSNYYDKVSFSYRDLGVAEYWRSIYYSDIVSVVTSSEADRADGIITVQYQNSVPYEVGDYVSVLHGATTVSSNASVLSIDPDNKKVRINADIKDEIKGVATIYYTPRTPVAGIPINYPYVEELEDIVDNRSVYAHTINTFKNEPVVDTYYLNTETTRHNDDDTLVLKSGDTTSVVCMKFGLGHINTTEGVAKIGMYISDMNYSSSTLVMYQMNSLDWDVGMSYSEISSYITNIPISSIKVENPSLDGYNKYVEFTIDPDIVRKWLNSTYQYPPSVAIVVATSGSPEVVFNSSENTMFKPYFIVSAGEKAALEPDLFKIAVQTSTAKAGEIIRLTVADYDGSFGNYIYNNVVRFQGRNDDVGVKGSIIAGNANYIDVMVPDDVTGNLDIVVYSKQSNGGEVAITEPFRFYVKNDAASRNKTIANKIEPGIPVRSEVSTAAWYSRDIGFSNFAEITDETSLIQNVYSILLTNRGERLFNCEFGSTIEEKIFSLASSDDDITVLKECIKLCGIYEPRVKIDPMESSCTFSADMNALDVTLCLILPSSRREFIYLTFKDRGKN